MADSGRDSRHNWPHDGSDTDREGTRFRHDSAAARAGGRPLCEGGFPEPGSAQGLCLDDAPGRWRCLARPGTQNRQAHVRGSHNSNDRLTETIDELMGLFFAMTDKVDGDHGRRTFQMIDETFEGGEPRSEESSGGKEWGNRWR